MSSICTCGASQVALGKESTCQCRRLDSGLIPESGRSPGGRHGNPLQYSCLENPMDRGAWRATVHRVAKSQTWLRWFNTQTKAQILVNLSKCHDVLDKSELIGLYLLSSNAIIWQNINSVKRKHQTENTLDSNYKCFYTCIHLFLLPLISWEDTRFQKNWRKLILKLRRKYM